jgi:hypothetical protein
MSKVYDWLCDPRRVSRWVQIPYIVLLLSELANGEWSSKVRSPAGNRFDQEAQRWTIPIYHKLIWLSAKRTDGIKYRNVG